MLALVLQLFSSGYGQFMRAAMAAGLPCPMHAGMMMPATGHAAPGAPASPNENCPCCGPSCCCAGTVLAMPQDWVTSAAIERVATRFVATARTKHISLARYATDALARGPPARSA